MPADRQRNDTAPLSTEVPNNVSHETESLREEAERSQGLLAAIVDSSDDAIVSKNLDGIITSWNRSAERLFGYTAEEAIGQHITLIIPPERHDEETRILEQLRRGERVDHFETVRVRRDGAKLDISLTISPVRDATGHVVGASKVARDITQRKQTERALTEQARLLDLATDAVIVRDVADRVTYWNRGAVELYGFTREEAMGQVTHHLLHTRFPDSPDSIRETLLSEKRWTGELTHKRKDGSEVVVLSRWALDQDEQGNQRSVLETNNDITQQKQTAEALRQSEEHLRALADGLEAQVRARTRELEHRNREVLDSSQQLRELWNRLVRTQEEERRHIARELHDSVGQYLAALTMVLDAAKNDAPTSLKLKEAIKIAEACVTEVRTISHLLHPPLLEEAGLSSAAVWYIEGFSERSGIQAHVDITEDLGRLSKDIELVLFRVLQESLTNVHRHSGSKTVDIRIGADAQHVRLEVEDQGKGGAGGTVRPGIGITGMRERVENLAGELRIDSSQNGTRVRVVLPRSVSARRATAGFESSSFSS